MSPSHVYLINNFHFLKYWKKYRLWFLYINNIYPIANGWNILTIEKKISFWFQFPIASIKRRKTCHKLIIYQDTQSKYWRYLFFKIVSYHHSIYHPKKKYKTISYLNGWSECLNYAVKDTCYFDIKSHILWHGLNQSSDSPIPKRQI